MDMATEQCPPHMLFITSNFDCTYITMYMYIYTELSRLVSHFLNEFDCMYMCMYVSCLSAVLENKRMAGGCMTSCYNYYWQLFSHSDALQEQVSKEVDAASKSNEETKHSLDDLYSVSVFVQCTYMYMHIRIHSCRAAKSSDFGVRLPIFQLHSCSVLLNS